MIKVIFCLRRLPQLSREEFQSYWLEKHAPLVRACAQYTGVRRYVQTHTMDVPELAMIVSSRGTSAQPYDGIAQLWWDNIEAMIAAGATKEGRDAGRAMLADEKNFIDLPNSPIFFAHEHGIIPPE